MGDKNAHRTESTSRKESRKHIDKQVDNSSKDKIPLFCSSLKSTVINNCSDYNGSIIHNRNSVYVKNQTQDCANDSCMVQYTDVTNRLHSYSSKRLLLKGRKLSRHMNNMTNLGQKNVAVILDNSARTEMSNHGPRPRCTANNRERDRTQSINTAFVTLRTLIPTGESLSTLFVVSVILQHCLPVASMNKIEATKNCTMYCLPYWAVSRQVDTTELTLQS